MATLTAEDTLDHLKSLHAAAVDSRDGYEAAVEDAEGHGLTPLFTKMTGLHQHHADELAAALKPSLHGLCRAASIAPVASRSRGSIGLNGGGVAAAPFGSHGHCNARLAQSVAN